MCAPKIQKSNCGEARPPFKKMSYRTVWISFDSSLHLEICRKETEQCDKCRQEKECLNIEVSGHEDMGVDICKSCMLSAFSASTSDNEDDDDDDD